jgi:hypothetical protein
MNRSALKTYAPKARLDFIRAVTDQPAFFGLTPDRTEPMQETGDVVLIGGRAFPRVVAEQREKPEERINQHGFDQVMEAMAYTWFNRYKPYRLVLREVETGIEQQSVEVTIDRAFTNDF